MNAWGIGGMLVLILLLLIVSIILYYREKRLRFLLRYFLHDLGNYLTVFGGLGDLLSMPATEEERTKAIKDHQLLFKQVQVFLQTFQAYVCRRYARKKDEIVDVTALLEKEKKLLEELSSVKYVWHFQLPQKPVIVQTNVYLLERMLDNLLFNVIHHAPTGSTVKVSLSLKEGLAELTVCNERNTQNTKQRSKEGLAFVEKFSKPCNVAVVVQENPKEFQVLCTFQKTIRQ